MEKGPSKPAKPSKEIKRTQEPKLTRDEFRLAVFCRLASAALGNRGDPSTPEQRLKARKNHLSREYPDLGLDDYEIFTSNEDMFIAINHKNKTAILAARGTCKWNIRDWGNDLSIALVLPVLRQRTLDKFVEKFRTQYQEYELTLTGYSLGGYLVEHNAIFTGLKCESFNRGSSPLFFPWHNTYPNIKSHTVNNDIISTWHGPGERVKWESEHGIKPHRLETFIEKYKRQNSSCVMETRSELENLDFEKIENSCLSMPEIRAGEEKDHKSEIMLN